MNVCFDTNVLVSAVAARGLCADIVNVVLAEHRLIVGATVLGELRQVLQHKLRVPVATVSELDAFLRLHATVIAKSRVLDIRGLDEGDLAVLSEAVSGKAEVLVTGDQELLGIAARAPIKVASPRGFWELLRGN